MKDFFDSLRQQISDRMSSPIFGSFVISWLVWNHKYLFILFSDLPVEYRFTLAKSVLYPDALTVLYRAVLIPAGMSVAYVVIYPVLSWPLLTAWDGIQLRVAESRNKAQGKRLLSREDSQKIILDALDERKRFQEALERQAREIEALRSSRQEDTAAKLTGEDTAAKLVGEQQRNQALVSELESMRKNAVPQNPIGGLAPEIQKGIRSLLAHMAKSAPQGWFKVEEIAKLTKLNPIRIDVCLDKLRGLNWIETSMTDGFEVMRLRAGARDFIVRERLDE